MDRDICPCTIHDGDDATASIFSNLLTRCNAITVTVDTVYATKYATCVFCSYKKLHVLIDL